MSSSKALALAAAAAALVVGQVAVGSASAAPASATALQQKIDTYLATHPDAQQVNAHKLSIPGGTLTVSAPGSNPSAATLACGSGHLCIQDGVGDLYDYYYCGLYSFDGIGDGVFNNNQTTGTVAIFYNSDGSVRWTNTAKDSGTASWTPVFYISPC